MPFFPLYNTHQLCSRGLHSTFRARCRLPLQQGNSTATSQHVYDVHVVSNNAGSVSAYMHVPPARVLTLTSWFPCFYANGPCVPCVAGRSTSCRLRRTSLRRRKSWSCGRTCCLAWAGSTGSDTRPRGSRICSPPPTPCSEFRRLEVLRMKEVLSRLGWQHWQQYWSLQIKDLSPPAYPLF
jgi:hypothetical protein